MSATLYSQGMLDTPFGLVLALLIGGLFGFFLEQAGFGSSRKLTGIFYFRDMAVLKVMFTGVVVALVGYRYLVAFDCADPGQLYLLDTYWGAQIVAGLVFGVGFVMGGWCPGTAVVGLAGAKWDALVFLVGVGLGSILFNEMFPLMQPLYEGTHAGVVTMSQTLRMSGVMVTLLFCCAAVAAFTGASFLEQKFGRRPPPSRAARVRHIVGACALIAAGAGFFFLPGSSAPEAAAVAFPAAASEVQTYRVPSMPMLLDEVVQGRDHIEPLELADLLMKGEPAIRLVDVRPAAAYAQYHLPGAVNLPLGMLARHADSLLPKADLVVLYSNGTTHAAQAWMDLRSRGWTNIRVLTDGLLGFWRDCLTPPSLDPVPILDEQAAQVLRAGFEKRYAFFVKGAATPSPAAAPVPHAKPAAPPPPALDEAGLEAHVVSTAWLAEHLTNPEVKVIDVRAKGTAYTTAHIPDALYLSCESLRSTVDGVPGMLLPAAEIALHLGRLGIGNTDTVVLYSDALRDATFVALALARVGHPSYAVLHGGFGKWTAEKRPVSSEIPRPTPSVYTSKTDQDTFTVGIDEVKTAMGRPDTVILDVRPPDYFRGDNSDEARRGYIPGAVNRHFSLDLVPGTELWQTAETLRAAYAKLGVTPDKRVIVHCRTGHQASQTYFLLKDVLGLPNVTWFGASWSAWAARPDLPATLGSQETPAGGR